MAKVDRSQPNTPEECRTRARSRYSKWHPMYWAWMFAAWIGDKTNA